MTAAQHGYAFLASLPEVTALQFDDPSQCVDPDARPSDDSVLSHVLFALKHQPLNLQILSQALPMIPEAQVRGRINENVSDPHHRTLGFLWEHFTGLTIPGGGAAHDSALHRLFNPEVFVTTDRGLRSDRWRVVFNGLGTLDYCVTVRKTPRLMALLRRAPIERLRTFIDSLSEGRRQEAVSWCYERETQASFAIERESPDRKRMERFAALLREAHQSFEVDEDYLVTLQGETMTNPFHRATGYRNGQNYLSNGPGASGIRYVPPPFELCRELMDELCAWANELPDDVDPLILATLVSFGFVFIHPFMDGNGRLSRFLFHVVLSRRGCLNGELIVPASAALALKEDAYLDALSRYSEQTRVFWAVDYADQDNISLAFQGHESLYRYWEGTEAVELMAESVEEALEAHLKPQVAHLALFGAMKDRVASHYSVTDSLLSKLVMFCLDQNGRLSKRPRAQYCYEVPAELFDALEQAYQDLNRASHTGSETGEVLDD